MKTTTTGQLIAGVQAQLRETPPDEGGVILTEVQTKAIYNALVDQITTSVKSGVEVKLTGLGILAVHARPARTGRNPRTGEAVEVPPKHVLRFKPSRILKKAVGESLPEGSNIADDGEDD